LLTNNPSFLTEKSYALSERSFFRK